MRVAGRLWPVTPGQRWVLEVAHRAPELGRPVQRLFRVRGEFDDVAFVRAITAVERANESLRLRIPSRRTDWRQRFVGPVAHVFGIDLPNTLGESDRMRLAALALEPLTRTPRSLSEESPVRFDMARLGPNDHVFAITVDHAAVDALGLSLVVAQIADAYGRARARIEIPVRRPGEFAASLAGEPAQDVLRAASAWWADRLAGGPAPPRRNLSGRRPAERAVAQIPVSVVAGCRAARWSPSMAFLAAQALLLARDRALDEVIINVPFSNRANAASRLRVANMSVLTHLRLQVDTRTAVSVFRAHVRQVVLEAVAHLNYDYGAFLDARSAERHGWRTGFSFVPLPPSFGDLEPVDADTWFELHLAEGTFLLMLTDGDPFTVEVLLDPRTWSIPAADVPGLIAGYVRALNEAPNDLLLEDLVPEAVNP
jgi:hypothetical protein